MMATKGCDINSDSTRLKLFGQTTVAESAIFIDFADYIQYIQARFLCYQTDRFEIQIEFFKYFKK